MGFFSSIKKLWSDKSETPAAEKARAEDVALKAAPESEAIPVSEDLAPDAESERAAPAGETSAATPEPASLSEPVRETVAEETSAPTEDAALTEPAALIEDAASTEDAVVEETPAPADAAATEEAASEKAAASEARADDASEVTPEPGRAAPATESPVAASGNERGFFSAIRRLWSDKGDTSSTPEPVSDAESVSRPAASAASGSSAAPTEADSRAALALKLREAEPRLSVWLGIVLEGVDRAGDPLWERLRFLLGSLEAPADEIEAFIADFRDWLERMEYEHVEEFRSELQYRLALALELEDEEDERSRLFLKLSEGLARTREQFSRRLDALFSAHGALDDAFWEEMEELFIMADVGYEPATELVERLRERARVAGVKEPSAVRALLQAELEEVFRTPRRISAVNPPEVVLMIGVNGVGKTTTIAKLAHRDRMQGKKVLIAAADTFRAAATEQLGVWAARVGADFHAKNHGADPAAVAYEAMDRAVAGGYDVLYVDTAGRLQTKVNLMEELSKIRNVLGKKHPGAPHRSILVIDATTGQNALSQTKLFKEAAGVDELIVTKLDGTAKGGVAIAVAMQFEVPITYVGLGEKLEDLRPFNGADYAAALLGARNAAEEER